MAEGKEGVALLSLELCQGLMQRGSAGACSGDEESKWAHECRLDKDSTPCLTMEEFKAVWAGLCCSRCRIWSASGGCLTWVCDL